MAPVRSSNRPRVVGPSKIGGRNRCSRRSPTSKEPPASSHTCRSMGISPGRSMRTRSLLKKFVTTVALGARARMSARLPMWSPSSWERNTQRTSAGSTTEATASSQRSRNRGAPVSTTTGCSARITIELMNTYVPGWAATRLGIRNVSGAMRCGSADGDWRVVGVHGEVLSGSLVGGSTNCAHRAAWRALARRADGARQAPVKRRDAGTFGRCGSGCSGLWRSRTTTGSRWTSAAASPGSSSPHSSPRVAAPSAPMR